MTRALNEKAARAGNLAADGLEPTRGLDCIEPASNLEATTSTNQSLKFLAIKPKKGSSAEDELNNVESTKRKLNAIDARWRGGKKSKFTGKYLHPNHCFRAIPIERKRDLLFLLEEVGISLDEVELIPIDVPKESSKYIKKAAEINEDVVEIRKSTKSLEVKVAREIHDLEVLNGKGIVSDEDLGILIEKVKVKYQQKIDELKLLAAKKESVEFKILREGSGSDADVLNRELAPFNIEELKKAIKDSEVGDAALFRKFADGDFIYDPDEPEKKSFYVWTGASWREDAEFTRRKVLTKLADIYAKAADLIEQSEDKASTDLRERSMDLKTLRRQNSVLELSKAGSYGVDGLTFPGEWDNHPGYIPFANGLLDLRTGRLLPPERNQFIRKASKINFDSSASIEEFHAFVVEIMRGSEAKAAFLQRFFGYATLGNPVEDRFLFLYGKYGRNGKGTLIRCVSSVLGDLARTFSPELLLLQRNPPSSSMPRPDLVHLKGTRLAVFSEINKGRQIDSAILKNLTGRDTIVGRSLFSNDVKNFAPTHTIVLQANHKPKAEAEDRALWSRAILIPFELSFVDNPQKSHERKVDSHLEKRLLSNPSGVVKWLIEGSQDYLRRGLSIPDEIKRETEKYREENDGIGSFIRDHCIVDNSLSERCGNLTKSIKTYCLSEGFNPPTSHEISDYLRENGVSRGHDGRGDFWRGLSIKKDPTTTEIS